MWNSKILRTIDIASFQKGIALTAVDCDAVIVKATQGNSYVNPYFAAWVNKALSLGRKVGTYHYATGIGVEAEVDHYLKVVGPYIGKVILCLDWETQNNAAGRNAAFNYPAYAEKFLDLVKERTGVTPVIYMSKSVCRFHNWGSVAQKYPLWVAQYANYSPMGWVENPWTDTRGYGAWDKPLLFQYTSSGRIPGYSGALDLSLAYTDGAGWDALASGADGKNEPLKVDTSRYPTVKMWNRSEYVRLLQQALTARGYPVHNDSIFGPLTWAAVRRFQKDHGLQVDGIVGPKTWSALFS